MELISGGERRSDTSWSTSTAIDIAVKDDAEIIALLNTSLDHLLQALGLEMGSIWLHEYKVIHGLPPEAIEIGKAAASSDVSIPHVQAVPDWQKIEEVYPELAPMADVMERLGIRASMAVSLAKEGRIGGLAVASSQPRMWSNVEIVLFEAVGYLLETLIKRIRVEEERRKASRALRVLSRCSEAIIRATDETTLMKELCHLIVEEGGYRLAWVGLAEEDATRRVRPVAQAGFEEGYLETVTITWDESEYGCGPSGTAIRTGRPVVVRDMRSDRAYVCWSEEATRCGCASSAALPLIAGGRTFGVLNIYSAEPDAFTEDEIELLCRLADNLAFGLEALRTRESMRESEAKYRALVEQAPDGIFLADAKGRFVDVNPSGCELLGYTRDEVLQLGIVDLIPPEDLASRPVPFEELRCGESVYIERRLRKKDGSLLPVEIAARRLDSGLLQGIVRNVSERKRMEEQVRRQIARTEALLRTASRLNAKIDLEHVLKVVCEEARTALQVPMAAVLLYDDRRNMFNLSAVEGLSPEVTKQLDSLLRVLNESYLQQKQSVVVIPELQDFPDRKVASLCADYDLRTGIGLKLQRDSQFIGVLLLVTREETPYFADDDEELLKGIADQAAQAITHARLFQETRRRLKLAQALRNIDLAIAGSFDLRVTFSVVLDEITAQLGMDAAAILIYNPYTLMLEYAAWRGFRTDTIKHLRLRLGEGYAGCAALERRTIQIPYLPEAERELVQVPLLTEEGFVVYYAVPLIAKGQIKGVLEIYHRSPVDPDGEWLQFLEMLAGQAAIAIDNMAMFDKVQHSHLELVLAYDATIEGWARALDLRDKETEGHSQRVTEMTLRLARALGMNEEKLVHIRRGALLHDIGKLGVPDSILLKAGPLTAEEWEIMRRHPQYAYEMLSSIAYLQPALDIPYCHHEKWDGTGYPRGLKGEQIPLAARIFAVVDVWDALSSDRPYRPAWPQEKVRAYLKEEAGKHFDPSIVEVFLKILEEENHRI